PLAPAGTPPLREGQRANDDEASQTEHDADEEEPVQQAPAEEQQVKRDRIGVRIETLILRHDGHRLIARQTRKLRDSDELVAARTQFVDDARECDERLRTVAAAIVQEDDFAARVRIRIERAVNRFLHKVVSRAWPAVIVR